MTLVKKLTVEIRDLSKTSHQTIFEIDGLGLLCSANSILNKFNNSDWKELNTELSNWSNNELQILAETITMGCEENNIVENNDTFGHIFTLVKLPTANSILINDIGDYLIEYEIESNELIDKMKLKLTELKNKQYLNEKEHLSWMNKIRSKKPTGKTV